MVGSRRVWILGALLLLAPPARGIALLADDRSVSLVVRDGYCCSESLEADSFAPFHAFVGGGQDSEIDVHPDGLGFDASASGQAVGANPEPLYVESFFSISFRIDGEGSLALSGCFDSDFFAFPGPGSVRVLAGGQVLFGYERGGGVRCFEDSFEFASDLAPGVYTVEALTRAGADGGIRFDFAFQVRDTAVPIPEPGPALPLALGLGAIAARRATGRRRR